MKEEEKVKHGKPWNVVATFKTYEEANEYRNKKLSIWKNQNIEGLQIKVKTRQSTGNFVVKTRMHPDFESKLKKEQKRGKRKGRNSRKRNTNQREV